MIRETEVINFEVLKKHVHVLKMIEFTFPQINQTVVLKHSSTTLLLNISPSFHVLYIYHNLHHVQNCKCMWCILAYHVRIPYLLNCKPHFTIGYLSLCDTLVYGLLNV